MQRSRLRRFLIRRCVLHRRRRFGALALRCCCYNVIVAMTSLGPDVMLRPDIYAVLIQILAIEF